MKQRTFVEIKKIKHIQNDTLDSPSETPAAKLGKTSPGPILSGALARARIVETDPMTWAASKVNTIWNRVSVLIKIIPKPAFPPCVSHDETCVYNSHGSKLTNTLNRVEHTKPEPEHSTYKSAGQWPTSPRKICAYVRCRPQHLAPAGCSQSNSEYGNNPCMSLGKHTETPEEYRPDNNEE